MTALDIKERIEAERRRDVPGGSTCPLNQPCSCPTCGVTRLLLRAALRRRNVAPADLERVTILSRGIDTGCYPSLASVRVDGVEVYRIHARPDEVFDPEVLDDITKALRRPM